MHVQERLAEHSSGSHLTSCTHSHLGAAHHLVLASYQEWIKRRYQELGTGPLIIDALPSSSGRSLERSKCLQLRIQRKKWCCTSVVFDHYSLLFRCVLSHIKGAIVTNTITDCEKTHPHGLLNILSCVCILFLQLFPLFQGCGDAHCSSVLTRRGAGVCRL